VSISSSAPVASPTLIISIASDVKFRVASRLRQTSAPSRTRGTTDATAAEIRRFATGPGRDLERGDDGGAGADERRERAGELRERELPEDRSDERDPEEERVPPEPAGIRRLPAVKMKAPATIATITKRRFA